MNKLFHLSIIWFLLAFCVGANAQVVLDFDETYAQEMLKPGTPAPDFQLPTPDGKTVKFSEFAKGKYVVIDFWASWCPDCRKENPNVVAAYQKYHDQGFDILGVSFDTNKEAWLAGIEKDGLTWTHVSDLQGWSNAAGALYAIAFIPQNALIKDGVIVARNLEGEELMEEIGRQLEK
jgi:peroxiredoxin